MLINTK